MHEPPNVDNAKATGTAAAEPWTAVEAWTAAGEDAALCTVIATWGSSPCPPGSRMAVRADGSFVGSVSGGCVESEVLRVSNDVIGTGRPRLLSFGVAQEEAWAVGLPCGGEIEVFIQRIRRHDQTPPSGLGLLRERRPMARCTLLTSGRIVLREPSELEEPLATVMRSEVPARVDTAEGSVFVEPILPPFHLILIGAVHIAEYLADLASRVGFAVTVVDPRAAFAERAQFARLDVLNEWPDDALGRLNVDARTAVVTLTHDPKLDEPGLVAALASPAFYVGALGSRKSQAARRRRLSAQGLAQSAIDRIRGPVGLPIGAVGPAEIAVSILAELIAAKPARPPAAPLRDDARSNAEGEKTDDADSRRSR